MIEIAALTLVLAAFREGREIKSRRADRMVDLTLTIKREEKGRSSVLAFGRVMNNSPSPVTVSEIAILFGDTRIERAPLTSLKVLTEGGHGIEAKLHTTLDIYDVTPGPDLRILDSDLYLGPQEARTGWMFFPIPRGQKINPDDAPSIELLVGTERVRQPVEIAP